MANLLNYSLFTGLDRHPEALQELSALLREREFRAREFLIDEKLNDNSLYFLVSGQVVINKMGEEGRIVLLGRADAKNFPHFGEGAILGKVRKIANVVAYTDCRCLVLSAKDFETFAARHPVAMASIYRNIASRLFDHLSKTTKDVFIAGMNA